MRVFESLNCIVCKQPFARVANQPRSPRPLKCGLAMCNECFEKEKEMDEEERKHQCGLSYCFKNRNFAYFLIDVLSQESALVFTPMGYVLLKPFEIPECPVCQEEFSNEIEAKKSFSLDCGHIICTDFLNELPEMTRQIETVEKAFMTVVTNALTDAEYNHSCNECHEKNIVDKMFYCGECSFEICGACAYKKHHPHKAIPLLEKKANQMSMELQQESKNVINACKDLFPELHKGLLEGINVFETKFLSKEEILKDASTFADLREKHESFTKIKSTFESYAEDYLPCLRKFDTGVNQLIQTLNEIRDA
ncbi:unnamed protein product, partial [Mesorhabditis belari]|uniref:B box-type domain-containing protein n=1 Tax=Mesorhabditis belari TaxID=2138241 RepID=A0AAF3ERR6_9BILA